MYKEHDVNPSPLIGIIAIFGGLALLLVIILAGRPQSLPLTKTYVSEDSTLTYNYPEGWVIDEAGGAQIIYSDVDSQDSQDGFQGLILVIAASWVDTGMYLDDTIRYADTPLDGLNAMLVLMLQADPEIRMQPVRSLAIHSHDAARVSMDMGPIDVGIVIFDEGDGGLYSVVAFAHEGDLQQYEPTIMAIIQSIAYTPTGDE